MARLTVPEPEVVYTAESVQRAWEIEERRGVGTIGELKWPC